MHWLVIHKLIKKALLILAALYLSACSVNPVILTPASNGLMLQGQGEFVQQLTINLDDGTKNILAVTAWSKDKEEIHLLSIEGLKLVSLIREGQDWVIKNHLGLTNVPLMTLTNIVAWSWGDAKKVKQVVEANGGKFEINAACHRTIRFEYPHQHLKVSRPCNPLMGDALVELTIQDKIMKISIKTLRWVNYE